MLRAVAVALLALSITVAAPTPVGAIPAYSATTDGPGWVALKYGALGETSLTLHAEGALPMAVGILAYNPAGGVASGVVRLYADGSTRVLLDSRDGESVTHQDVALDPATGEIRIGASVRATGALRAVVWVSGGVSTWSLDVTGPASGVTATTGDDVFLHTPEDFQGRASLDARVLGKGARASVGASAPVEVASRLVAFGDARGPDSLRFGPSGSPGSECPCLVTNLGAGGVGPGSYEFRLTGAGTSALPEAYAGGADVTLPP